MQQELCKPMQIIHQDPLPLHEEEGGVIRVGKTRVTLDVIVECYENGLEPEDIVRAYDTLELGDVYAVISFYLHHRDEVRAYLAHRAQEARTLRAQVEAKQPPITRTEMLARRARKKDHAPTGQ